MLLLFKIRSCINTLSVLNCIGLVLSLFSTCLKFSLHCALKVDSVFLLIYLINKMKKIIKSSLDVQDYPKNRHPGWSRGSIAYHAGEHASTLTEHWQYLLLLAVGLDTVNKDHPHNSQVFVVVAGSLRHVFLCVCFWFTPAV